MRYEIKFTLQPEDIGSIIEWLTLHKGFQKSYPDRGVNSLYYDSLEYDAAIDNLSGISDRVKYRIRWYSSDGIITGTRYEIKTRQSSLGTKATCPCSIFPEELLKLTPGNMAQRTSSDPDCRKMGRFAELYPSLLVTYTRSYFESFSGIRVTIDKAISFINVREADLQRPCTKREFVNYIVELKFDPSCRDIVSESMTDFPLRPLHMSKYLLGLSLNGIAIYS